MRFITAMADGERPTAAGYVRVSTEQQREEGRHETQRQRL